MAPLNFISSGRSVRKRLPLENKFVDYTHYCESSISMEGGRSKDRLRLCSLYTSFQEGPHQKLFFDLIKKNYVQESKGLGWMKKYRE